MVRRPKADWVLGVLGFGVWGLGFQVSGSWGLGFSRDQIISTRVISNIFEAQKINFLIERI
jgi:hypothetical protein